MTIADVRRHFATDLVNDALLLVAMALASLKILVPASARGGWDH